MIGTAKKDLIVLVADKCMEAAVRGLLSRHQSLGIRNVTADMHRHPEKDTGCRMHGVDFLATFTRHYCHALLMFDFEGCGDTTTLAREQENDLRRELGVGWGERADAIIIEPELDVWVWSPSPHVESILGWKDKVPSLREWLVDNAYLREGASKPDRPKEALAAALRMVHKPPSSSLYEDLARNVSLKECVDPSFCRFRDMLKKWFGEISHG
ncbi:MAG: hypothetical protein HY922_10080 [Elusimicrobia bacterium]|nr:hypothetical protein [Elusimicrobiota bacterium]